MKRKIIVFIALVFLVPLVAQEGGKINEDNQLSSKDGLKRITYAIDIGATIGDEPGIKSTFCTVSYRIDQNYSIGIGSGYYIEHNYNPNWGYLPVFVDFKLNSITQRNNFCHYMS